MKLRSVAIVSSGLLIGVVGAGVAYELSAVDPGTATSSPAFPAADATGKPRVRWAPCKPPAVREGRACVTEVARTVTVPAAVGTARPVGATAPPASAGAAAGGRDDHSSGHHGSSDHDDDRADDRADLADDRRDAWEDLQDDLHDAREDAWDDREDAWDDRRDAWEDRHEDGDHSDDDDDDDDR